MAADLESFGTWRWTQASWGHSTMKTWWQDGLPAPWQEAPRGPPPAPAPTAELFPRPLAWEKDTKAEGIEDWCLHAGHSPCLQTPTQGLQGAPSLLSPAGSARHEPALLDAAFLLPACESHH